MTTLRLDQIRIDGGTQPRTRIDEVHLQDLVDSIESNARVPAVDVFFDGAEHWLADGFHRFHAHKSVGVGDLFVVIHQGTRRDAVLFSVGANCSHGLKRTNEDKRKSVMTLLDDQEWSRWSDREIARRCGVTHEMVGHLRPSLAENASEPRTYTTKHGTEAQMNVGGIGHRGTARSKKERAERMARAKEMAEQGYTTRQMAKEFGISDGGLRLRLRELGIDVPGDRAIGKSKRHKSTRIIEQMVMDAENLTADVNLIDFDDVNPNRFAEWVASFTASRKALDVFIRQLVKEQEKHGEAA